MANELVRFTTGLKANLGNESKQAGKVLFVLNDDDSTGSIYFDKDSSHRYRMSYDLKDTTNTFTASAAAVTTTSGRVYPVALDKDGFLAVNVPWTNTTYSAGNGLYLSSLKFYNTGVLSIASGDANGTIKVTTGTNAGGTSSVDVAVKGLKDLAYIAKPSANTTTTYLRGDGTWVTPPNTTYNGSLGVTLSGTTFKASLVSETQNTAAAGSGKLYAVQLDKNGKLAVNVPWTDNDHQYTASGKGITLSGTQFALSLKDDTFKTTDAAVLPATANTNRTYPLVLDKNSVLAVNVPWTDTTYGPATTGAAGLMSAADKQKLDGIAAGAKTGTVTSIATGIGLTGGTITTSGTIKVKLKDETLSTYEASNSSASGASQYYTVTADKKGDLAVYVPWLNTTYSPGTGITIGSGNQINHSNSITAGTAKGDNNKTLTWSGTFTIPTVTYDAQGHITATGTTTMTMPANPHSETIYTGTAPISVNSSTKVISINNGAIANAKLQNSSLSIAGNSVSLGGSLDAATLRTSLGLSSAMHYIGKATVDISDGGTQDPTITDYDFANVRQAGDVIIDKNSSMEYVWTGTAWERLGSETSFKTIQTAVSSPSASGTTTSFIDTISQDTNGKITVTKKTVTTATTSAAGITTLNATTANTLLNQLTTGSSTPVDADYYISQYVGGGTTTTTYHRRPMSALWSYIKGKADSVYLGISANAASASKWANARNFSISDNDATNTGPDTSVDGSAAGYTIKLPATIKATLTGNASTATKLAASKTIAISGAVTGTATAFDGSANITIPTTAIDMSKATGTLSVGHGGTGITSTPSLLVNLESETAQGIYTATLRPGVTGVLPITHGGTGGNSFASARTNLGVNKIYSGTCATAAGTLEKAVVCSNFALEKGAVIFVTFDNTNTGAVANLTLNVNSTGAKPIKHQYNASESNIPNTGYIRANQTYMFYYDGTNWVMITDYNSDTHYTTHLRTASSDTGTTQVTAATSNPYLNLLDNSTVRDSVRLVGSGATTIQSSADGKTITISSTDNNTNTTYSLSGALASHKFTTTLTPSSGSATTSDFTLSAGNNITLTDDTTNRKITISAIDTKYSAGTGLSLSGTTFNHSNSVTAKTAAAQSAKTLTWGGTFTLYEEKYDAQGHITGVASYNMTMPSNPNTDAKVSQIAAATTDDDAYRVLLSGTASDDTFTGSVKKDGDFTYNPSTNTLTVGTVSGALSGNASTATKLANARTIAISGGATGTATSFDGSDNITISVTALDVSKANAGTLAVARGGTGITAVSAYEILYGNTSNNGYARLTPNTTTTKKFLRMTGTGSAGAAPVWDTVTKSDVGLGNVENTKLSTWTGNTSISSIGTLTTGSIPWSLLTGIPSSFTPGTHSHGNITNDGKTSTAITLANNDFILVGDSSDGGKIGKGPVFDASTETTALTQKGTWVTYAGGTAVTLNGTSKAKSTANFYAPTASGTANQVLISGGANTAPSWTNQSNLSVGSATLATSAQKFDTNRTISLTGDTTGSASSNGASGWSITTTTKRLSQTTATALSSFTDTNALIYTAAGGSNTITDKPTSVDAFGALSFKTADGWYGQLLMSSNTATGIYWRTATSLSGGWKKILDSTNYTDYTVTKTGSGASGSWGISITGNAATATTANKLGTTSAGSATKPIYWANGIPAEANTYAGGTAVTLNGTNKASSTASFYAPEGAGTSGQYLKSNGSGAPTWATFPTSMTPTSHTHGNITNAGTMNPSQITIANNDFIVVGDYSDSTGKITKGPIFDGSTTTSVLSQKGTWTAASPSISITAGTTSDAPKVNVTVLGASGTAQALTKASTSVYGVTKLSSAASSTEETLAATPKGVQAAIDLLDVSDAAAAGRYVSQVVQTNGKITVTRADFAPSLTLTAGTASAAPKLNVTVNTKSGTAVTLTTATTGVYGVTKLSSTSSTSEEGLAATPKGVWAAIDTVKYKVTQSANTENKEFPILLKNSNTTTAETATVKFTQKENEQKTTINPSTGTISAGSYKVANKVQLQYDSNTESLNFVFI